MAQRHKGDEDQGSIWLDLGHVIFVIVTAILATLVTLMGSRE